MTSPRTPRLAVLASGRGTNFRALTDAARAGTLGGDIVVLASDRQDSGAVELARHRGITVELLADAQQTWVDQLRRHDVDTILLAGFMRILRAEFLTAFPGRILNLHPSLLPAFPGMSAIARALSYGVRVTGATVHLVSAEVDDGPILAQAVVPVLDDETLARLTARVHACEHELYPRAV